jgi:hypothetical protein
MFFSYKKMQQLICRRSLSETDQFLLAALFSSVTISYILIILTTISPELFVNYLPIFIACLLFAGCIGVFAQILGSVHWAIIICYILLGVGIHLPKWILFTVALLLSLPSALCITFTLLRTRRKAISYLFLGCISALPLFSAKMYTWADISNRLHNGNIKQDTLFHVAIASMIKTYGVASTGLNGLVEIHYHTFSHRLFATLSELSGAPVVSVYGIAPHILFAPLLVYLLSYVAIIISSGVKNLNSVVCSWTLVCIILSVLPRVFAPWCLWDSYFGSESYLVSLILLVISIPTIIDRKTSFSDILFITTLSVLATLSKGSVGLLISCLIGLKALFYSERKLLSWVAVILVGAIVVVLSLNSAGSASSFITFDPLHFLWSYSKYGIELEAQWQQGGPSQMMKSMQWIWLVIQFMIMHFALTWMALISLMYKENIRYDRFPLIVINVGAVFFGVGPVLLLAIPGGSAYYFSNISMFVAMPLIVSIASGWVVGKNMWKSNMLIPAAGVIIILAFSAKPIINKFYKYNIKLNAPKNPVICELDNLRLQENKTAIYIPTQKMLQLNPVERFSARPFLFPAVSEKMWTGVLENSDAAIQEYKYYGYDDYLTPEKNKIADFSELQMKFTREAVDVSD